MKKFFIMLLFMNSVFGFNLEMHHFKEPPPNLGEHFFASAVVSVTADDLYCDYYKNKYNSMPTRLQRFVVSTGTSIFIGTLKEIYDSQAGEFFNHKDIKADILGSVFGSLLQITLRW